MNRAACSAKIDEHSSCMLDCKHVISVLEKAKPAVEGGCHTEPEAVRHLFVKALCRLAVSQSKIGAVCLDLCVTPSYKEIETKN
jgi:hypothetical protein